MNEKPQKIERFDTKYYINNIKALSTWKKALIIIFLLLSLIFSKYVSFWLEDDDKNFQEPPPIFGIKSSIKF